MTAWWKDLSVRERTLLLAMAGLFGVIVFWFLVWRPVFAWHANGRLALDTAQTTASYVAQAADNAGDTGEGGVSGAALRRIVTASATENQVPVSAFQLSQSGTGLTVTIEAMPADRLYAWLGRLETQNGIEVVEARISQARAEAMVQARLTLGQGG